MGLLQAVPCFPIQRPGSPIPQEVLKTGLKAVHANRFFPAVQGGGTTELARSSDQEWRCIRKQFESPTGASAANRGVIGAEDTPVIGIRTDHSDGCFGTAAALGRFSGIPCAVFSLILIAGIVLAAGIGMDVVNEPFPRGLPLLIEDVASGNDRLRTPSFMAELNRHLSIHDGGHIVFERNAVHDQGT